MRIVISLLFILSNGLLNGGSTEEHVHFKIYVPEIIKHQIHTKTVFIHVHKPPDFFEAPKKHKEEAPKKNKPYHKEVHHEDWSSWSNYGFHSDEPSSDLFQNQKDHKSDDIRKEMAHKDNPIIPIVQNHKDPYMPMVQHDKPDFMKEQHERPHGDSKEYMYPPPRPPQYEVKEDVKEIDHNDIVEPYVHTYEEGYSKGGESAHGHTYSGDVAKFYEGKHAHGDHSVEEYENDSREKTHHEKTHAGRYFVDDSEYEHNNKVEQHVFPKIFGWKVRRTRGNRVT